MTKSAFNEEDKPYVEIFKEWLEENNHTSLLELLNWEHRENKIKLKRDEYYLNSKKLSDPPKLHGYALHWNREAMKQANFDKEEKNLELVILLYQWLGSVRREECPTLMNSSIWREIKELQKELTNYRFWKKNKKPALILGIILALVLITYLMWPNSERPHKETTPDNDNWPLRPNKPLWL